MKQQKQNVKTEKGGVKGMEEGYKVGLTYHRTDRVTHHNTKIKTGGKNIINKNSISSISFDVLFKMEIQSQYTTAQKGERRQG